MIARMENGGYLIEANLKPRTCQNCQHTGQDVHLRYFGRDTWGKDLNRMLCDNRPACRKRELQKIKLEALKHG